MLKVKLLALIVLWGCIDMVPALVLETSMFCTNETQIGAGDTDVCRMHKCTVFLVMIMNYLLMCWFY